MSKNLHTLTFRLYIKQIFFCNVVDNIILYTENGPLTIVYGKKRMKKKYTFHSMGGFFFSISVLVLLFGFYPKDRPNPDQIFYVQFKFRACGLNLKLFKGVQYI